MAAGAAALLQTQAGTFTANFNDNAVPAGAYLNGSAGGGVIEEGILKITKNLNGQTGGFVIEDLDAGMPVYGFNLTAKVRVGGGTATPADGFSISFAPDIATTTGASPAEYENGVGSGLRIAFDIFDNGNENPPAPSIDLRIGGTVVQSFKTTFAEMRTGTEFADLNLTVSAAGGVTLVYEGVTIFSNLFFPGYQELIGARLAIAGRTGGLNENVWFDDISFTTFTTPQVGIVQQPQSVTVLAGTSVEIAPRLNNIEGATFQWFRNGVALEGATGAALVLSGTLADSGARYSLVVTGPNNTVTTTEATLTVVEIPLPAPTAFFDFNSPDGNPPAGTTLFGFDETLGGYISIDDGINVPGILHLTDAVNGQRGGIIVEDLAAGAPVYGITAAFKLRIGGGSAVPADGLSFNFAPNIPDFPGALEYENGVGTGLTVGFDIYNNGGGEAPAVEVRYNGALIGQVKVPLAFLLTGDEFTDVIIRLENDGTIDVSYKGVVLFNNLLVPGFSSITGGRVLIGARTGGLNANMWVDDLAITTVTTAGDLRITTQPTNRYVLAGQTVNLTAAVNDPTGVTFQWLRNGEPISGANTADLSFVATAADNGAQYSLRVTRGGLTATSDASVVTVLAFTPTVDFTFDAGVAPAGTVLAGNAYVSIDGGVNDTGVAHITDAVNGQSGALVIQPLLEGAEVAAINVAFDLRLGGGTANSADGFSFNWAAGLPDTTIGGAEEGAGNGLTIAFDIYDNGGGEAPSIDVKWRGATIASTRLTKAEIRSGSAFRTVIVKVTAEGRLDLVYGDRVLQTGLQLPNYAPITAGKFGFYARTGGENENQWVDNVRIEAIKSIAPLRVVTEPVDALLLPGQTATFTVSVSDPIGAAYQWFRNGVAIEGATTASFTTPALALTDSGAQYSVRVTGTGGTVTSRAAIATVVAPITIGTPDVAFNFNDFEIPLGTTLIGSAGGGYVGFEGGIENSGVLRLTDAANGQGGSFFITAIDEGTPVSSFTANFKLRIGGGTAVPADGLSFVWAPALNTTTVFGEDGAGEGLTVSFDTYDNAAGEAPAFDILWKGTIIATAKVPIATLLTDDAFADVTIRLEADGTVDLQYDGLAIFNNVQLPNFAAQTDAYFAFGGRTGGLNANQWIDDIKIVTGTGAAPAELDIARNQDGSVTITWAGGGMLQAAPTVTGPWDDQEGVNSPATIQTSGQMQFFRVVR